ncbi:Abi-alpha family protein [Chryseobacterium sp.]|uniref:Abi-alpha family protein n=1 Tax=Chryseobacterium sp. TaxID=1871047 RepID=UPI0011CA547F|nr:Abi-alpha family protein [Chryseobacterium sp.]TXF76351.1 hypothetical protein FUA25_10735 [Chryseobacterium sp.]
MNGLELLASKKAIDTAAASSEKLIKGLFGSAFNEAGELIADQVRLRRFKNQVLILEKAQKYLVDKKVEYQKINLKVLAPLLEFSSFEEDERLQEMWAMLIKNLLVKPFPILLQQNAISVLNKISNEEVSILNYIYIQLNKKRSDRAVESIRQPPLSSFFEESKKKQPADFRIDWFSFAIKDISQAIKLSSDSAETLISNLVAIGTLKYETEVEITSAEKSSEDPEDRDLEIDLEVTDYAYVKMTKLGFVFVELCKD